MRILVHSSSEQLQNRGPVKLSSYGLSCQLPNPPLFSRSPLIVSDPNFQLQPLELQWKLFEEWLEWQKCQSPFLKTESDRGLGTSDVSWGIEVGILSGYARKREEKSGVWLWEEESCVSGLNVECGANKGE